MSIFRAKGLINMKVYGLGEWSLSAEEEFLSQPHIQTRSVTQTPVKVAKG